MLRVFETILLNLIFYPLAIVWTVGSLVILTLPVASLRPFLGKRKHLKLIRYVILVYGYVIVRCFTFPFVRVNYKDYEKRKKMGPCVYVCNHRSFSDAFFMSHLNTEGIQVVNTWPFRIPILGFMARLAGYLNINRMSFENFLRKACELLREGVSIVAFPEGSRTGNRAMSQFNGAVFRVAMEARCPIVPLCISGSENIPLKGSFILNPGTVKVHKLPALAWEEYKDLSPFHLKNKVRDMIQTEMDVMEKAC